ncbi:hypothetical protein B0H21DRAFT_752566 [Amylocystis lapponica]|nr:hypothetical protein B0H21DRAFT_752566 [Amylocystis lapponica]
MGPTNKHDDLASAINHLKSQLQVYTARTSQAHARLLSTLESMDELRAAHFREISLERRTNERLSAKLYQAMSVVVEKVELQNNYALWPHSQIRLAKPLEPMHPRPRPTSSSAAVGEVDGVLWTHATAVVTSLRTELEAEREAHACTREHAESEILALTAALARREAELEACVVHADHMAPAPKPEDVALPRRPPQAEAAPRRDELVGPRLQPFTRQEAIKILEISAARNRALEIEVKSLIDRVSIPSF